MLGKKADIRVGSDFSTIPADKYTAQVADVNFKMQFNKFKNVEEEVLNFQYVVLDSKDLTDEEGKVTGTTRGKYLWHRMSQSLNSKSWLMKLAKAVYGRDLTKEELDPKSAKFFNPEDLVGKQVDVMVVEEPNKDNTATFNNVVSYAKNTKPLQGVEVANSQKVVTTSTESTVKVIKDGGLENPALDSFMAKIEKKAPEKDLDGEDVPEEEEESMEELELKMKIAKAKAKKAKEGE